MVSKLTSSSETVTVEEHTHKATGSAFHLTTDEVEGFSSYRDEMPWPHFRARTRAF